MKLRWARTVPVVVLLLCAGVCCLRLFPLSRTMEVRPLYMKGVRVFAYQWSLPESLFWRVPSDGPRHPQRSTLALFENGRELGPAHSQHLDIVAKGKGRFSHWNGRLIFSSSDLTEPRYNKKRYTIRVRPIPRDWLLWTSLGACGALLAWAGWSRIGTRRPRGL